MSRYSRWLARRIHRAADQHPASTGHPRKTSPGGYLEYYAHTHASSPATVVGAIFHPDKYGSGFRHGDALSHAVTLEILALQEAGELGPYASDTSATNDRGGDCRFDALPAAALGHAGRSAAKGDGLPLRPYIHASAEHQNFTRTLALKPCSCASEATSPE
ncbi:hypothetical protein KXR53_32775 [Inquilinus limosus]|uniref:hypothetical protein n=1 Tax=Inquilinus limosus TaxID=171674 RepID=UPI003F143B92